MSDEYKFPMMLRTAMERAAVVLHNLANVRHRELDEDSQGLMRRVLDDLDAQCIEANLATRRAESSPVADDGLPRLPKHFALFNIDGPDGYRIKGYAAEQVCQAIREAYEAGRAAGVPDGWQLVPIEPTDKMRGATRHQAYIDLIDEDWAAMLAAAPRPPKDRS